MLDCVPKTKTNPKNIDECISGISAAAKQGINFKKSQFRLGLMTPVSEHKWYKIETT
jgi:hypothetical protein